MTHRLADLDRRTALGDPSLTHRQQQRQELLVQQQRLSLQVGVVSDMQTRMLTPQVLHASMHQVAPVLDAHAALHACSQEM